jgi:HlyD family secretion protein
MTRKRWIAYAGLGAAVGAAFVWAFRPQPVPVEAAEVRQGRFVQTVDEDGVTRVRERYVIAAPVSGRLARMRVKAGDAVQAASPVAELWPAAPSMIDARTARELDERVGSAEAGVEQARARVASAEAAFAQAGFDVRRQLDLQAHGFVAAAAVDQARTSEQVQARSLEAARFAQQAAEHELGLARAALLRARETAATRRPGTTWPIESPVSGRVLRVLQESETPVAVGTPLLEVGDPAELEVVVDVLSTDGRRIAPGARVELDAGPGPKLDGRVRLVEPAAFTKVSALGVEEQRVNVIIDIVSPASSRQGVGDQFRVDARIVVLERADVVIAPVAALFRDGSQWAVFVAAEGRAQKRRVEVGARNGSQAWIQRGLAAGERVIVYPSDSVHDGVRTRLGPSAAREADV